MLVYDPVNDIMKVVDPVPTPVGTVQPGTLEEETAQRAAADDTLQTNINDEASTRFETDNNLQDQITNINEAHLLTDDEIIALTL